MFQDLSRDKKKVDKIHQLYYLIHTLLPVLKQINQDQSIELEIDAKTKGTNILAVQATTLLVHLYTLQMRFDN